MRLVVFTWYLLSPGRFVSLEDAERTIKTGQPPEMRMEVSATAVAPQPVRAAPAAESARAAPARLSAPVQNGPAAAAEPARVCLCSMLGPCTAAAVQGEAKQDWKALASCHFKK